MSEFDSLSDSDWLDISSNGRGDSDNDSIASQDSDRDDHLNSRPISRLSSFSNASSVNGEVDAWEGLLSDGGDDAAELPHGTLEDPIQSGNDVKEAHDDEDEDERVRMALDQSFVGTLNASRTSALTHSFGSGSVPTPIRDIRLSFPDPLTSSSPDKLNLSFEALSSTEAGDTSLSNGSDTSSSTTYDNSMVLPSLPPQDPGRVISTPAVRHHEAQLSGSVDQSELEIVLYGSSSTAKWRFVQELIGKAASYAGYALDAAVLQDTPERQATVHLTKQSEEALPFFDTVVVLDKTTDSEKAAQSPAIESINRPSLAVVFLPVAKLPALAWHTSYLPVVVPSDPEEKGTMLAVEDDWDLLGVPQYRTSRLALGSSRFFDSQQSQTIVGGRAYQLLHGLSDEVEEPTPKPLTEHLKSVNTVKLVALMSLFVGFAVNTAFPSTAPAPTPTINRATTTNIWRILAEQNQSILPQTRGGTSNSQTLMSGSVILSDVSLSLFNPGTTALSVPPPPEAKSISLTASASSKALSEVPTTTPSTQCQVSGPTTALAEPSSSLSIIKTPSSDVVLLRPAVTPVSASGAKGDKAKAEDVQLKTPMSPTTQSKALSAAGSDAPVAGPSKPRASPVASPSSMPSSSSAPFNAKEAVVSTVSDAFDTSAKVFSDVVNSVGAIIPDGLDAELLEATNVLYSSLITQTDKVVKNWNSNKGKAKERLETANGRAKKNAKKIKEKGSEFLWSAGQQFVDKTKRARKNAKEVWGMATGVNDGDNGDGFDDDAGENWVEWDSGSPSLTRKQMRKMRRDARRAAREAEGGKENAVPWTSGGGRESGESGCPRRRSGQAPCAAAGDFAQGMWFQFGF